MIKWLVNWVRRNPFIFISLTVTIILIVRNNWDFIKLKLFKTVKMAGEILKQSNQTHISKLHPKIREKAKAFYDECWSKSLPFDITSSLRTFAEQTALYNQGRTTKGNIVTQAQAGDSLHNYGLAFDIIPIVNGKRVYDSDVMKQIAQIGKKHGFDWGGDWQSFKDTPHFEIRLGKTLSQLKALYNSGHRNGDYVIV